MRTVNQVKIDRKVADKIIIPSPVIKSPHGKVPSAMPKVPNRFGTKFIIAEAVPTFSFALFSKISMLKGRTTVSMTVKGKNETKNAAALKCPGNRTKNPLANDTAKDKYIMRFSDIIFFSLKYNNGPRTEAAAFAAKK